MVPCVTVKSVMVTYLSYSWWDLLHLRDPGHLLHYVQAAPRDCIASGQMLVKQLGTEATQENIQAESAQGTPSVWESHGGRQMPRPMGRPGSNVWAHGQELKITETGRKTRLKVGGGDKDPQLLWMDLEDGKLEALGHIELHSSDLGQELPVQ